jgi:hypothetical protein
MQYCSAVDWSMAVRFSTKVVLVDLVVYGGGATLP